MVRIIRICVLITLLTGWSITALNIDSRRLIPGNDVSVPVRAVLVDNNGIKWFGTDRGLYRYDNQDWRYYSNTDYLAGEIVTALSSSNQANGPKIIVATNKGMTVLTFDELSIWNAASYNLEQGLMDDSITSLVIDSFHRLYCGSEQGISVFHLGSVEYLTFAEYPSSMVDAPVKNLYIYRDTLYTGADGGIGRFVANVDGISGASRWTSEYGITPLSGNIKSLFVDAEGHQWFGTDNGVEEHIGTEAKKNWLLYSTSDGLIDNHVLAIAEDMNGGMWFGTKGGASYLSGDVWTSFTSADGLASDTVYSIGIDLDGSAWFGTHRGVSHLIGSEFENMYTGIHETVQEGSTLVATYNQAADEIRIHYHAQVPGNALIQLYSIEGKLIMKSEQPNLKTGLVEYRIPANKYMNNLVPGLYIISLHQQGESSSASIIIPAN